MPESGVRLIRAPNNPNPYVRIEARLAPGRGNKNSRWRKLVHPDTGGIPGRGV